MALYLPKRDNRLSLREILSRRIKKRPMTDYFHPMGEDARPLPIAEYGEVLTKEQKMIADAIWKDVFIKNTPDKILEKQLMQKPTYKFIKEQQPIQKPIYKFIEEQPIQKPTNTLKQDVFIEPK